MAQYVLIEVEQFHDEHNEIIDANTLMDYILEEINEKEFITGKLHAFKSKSDLIGHVFTDI